MNTARSLGLILLISVFSFSVSPGRAHPVEDARERAFDAALEETRKLMEAAHWEEARDQILTLLDDHAREDYVLRNAAEIQEQFRRCVIKIAVPEPDPREVISGKLMSYSSLRGVGQIHVRYSPQNLGDFHKQEGRVLVHPLAFEGSYTVEISGPSFTRPPVIFVGMKSDEAYLVKFGYKQQVIERRRWGGKITKRMKYVPATVTHIQGGKSEEIAEKDKSPVMAFKPFRLVVAVSESRITARYNGKQVITARKKTKGFGSFAFVNFPDFKEIIIRGRANSSWLKGVVDEEARKRKKNYLLEADPERGLPDWFRSHLAKDVPSPVAKKDDLSTLIANVLKDEKTSSRAATLLREGKFTELVTLLDTKHKGGSTEPLRSFLLLASAMQADNWEDADELSASLVSNYPHISEFQTMRSITLSILGPEAMERHRRVLADKPGEVRSYIELTQLLMLDGKLTDARDLLARADSLEIKHPEIDNLRTQLVKAEFGPSFNRAVFREESPDYFVVTDIDAKTARDAIKHLEELRKTAKTVFGAGESRFPGKSRVFVFSGEAGFNSYLGGFSIQAQHNRVGLYSLLLKQLLIWNVPNRDVMLHTVRHEAMHQFLDELGLSLPIWLNEGLAEDLAIQTRHSTYRKNTKIEISGPYVRTLLRNEEKMIPLREFLEIGNGRFSSQGTFAYAYAWAVVHYLRHGDLKAKTAFLRLMEGVRKKVPRKELLEYTFQGKSIELFEMRFREFLKSLDR